jgi:hypothetical protein
MRQGKLVIKSLPLWITIVLVIIWSLSNDTGYPVFAHYEICSRVWACVPHSVHVSACSSHHLTALVLTEAQTRSFVYGLYNFIVQCMKKKLVSGLCQFQCPSLNYHTSTIKQQYRCSGQSTGIPQQGSRFEVRSVITPVKIGSCARQLVCSSQVTSNSDWGFRDFSLSL